MTSPATIKSVTVTKNEVATPAGKPTKCTGECCRNASMYIRRIPNPAIVLMKVGKPLAKIEITHCPFCGGKLV